MDRDALLDPEMEIPVPTVDVRELAIERREVTNSLSEETLRRRGLELQELERRYGTYCRVAHGNIIGTVNLLCLRFQLLSTRTNYCEVVLF